MRRDATKFPIITVSCWPAASGRRAVKPSADRCKDIERSAPGAKHSRKRNVLNATPMMGKAARTAAAASAYAAAPTMAP
jgi:hypothetical protein